MRTSFLAISVAFSLVAAPGFAQEGDLAGSMEALRAKAAEHEQGLVRVIVRVDVDYEPRAALPSEAAAEAQQQALEAAQATVVEAVPDDALVYAKPLENAPYVVFEVTEEGLTALQESGRIIAIQEDELARPLLQDSVPLIKAPSAWNAGFTGDGQAVAILDTGVNTSHPAFAGRIAAEACFSSNSAAQNAQTLCPNGQESQTGSGAGVNCATSIAGCDHGTHVAGIAAGDHGNLKGVAPDSDIIPIQVFSRFDSASICSPSPAPCVLSFTSDQIAALQHVVSLTAQHDIASANMSLGGGKSTTACDTDVRKGPIDDLVGLGIATAIASGNAGFTDGVGFPACISTAVTVGSTTKADNVSVFSNSAPLVDLLAPGSSIVAPVPGGGSGVKSGTSMATPHVAGAFAVLGEYDPSTSVSARLTQLVNTGVPITDSRNNLTKPRINLEGIVAPAAGRLGYAWAHSPTSASYTPSATYSYNSSGQPISITRSGTGRYSVRFQGLGGSGTYGGHVQVTGYGGDDRDCKVHWWSSGGSDFIANVRCMAPNGSLADARYTVLVMWP